MEEACELESADVEDVVECIDAVIDSLYFGMGVLYKMGIDDVLFTKIFTAVHEANMTKKKGTNSKRDLGAADAIKLEGWVSPEARIQEILNAP